jgi:uncharacterized protein YheU (UPF0270 family)
MRIPWDQLSDHVLNALVEEFITREGTEYGDSEVPLERKVHQVRGQLKSQDAVIVFDTETQTCNIVLSRDLPS